MKGYCSTEDIEAYYMNKTFRTGDYINDIKVKNFIGEDARIIDAALQTRYSLPISNGDDLLLLKSINAKMVVGTIDDITREKNAEGRFERGRNTRKEALDMLEQIKNGEILLSTTEEESLIKFNSVDSEGNTVEKRFKDSNIEPNGGIVNRENRTIIRES